FRVRGAETLRLVAQQRAGGIDGAPVGDPGPRLIDAVRAAEARHFDATGKRIARYGLGQPSDPRERALDVVGASGQPCELQERGSSCAGKTLGSFEVTRRLARLSTRRLGQPEVIPRLHVGDVARERLAEPPDRKGALSLGPVKRRGETTGSLVQRCA